MQPHHLRARALCVALATLFTTLCLPAQADHDDQATQSRAAISADGAWLREPPPGAPVAGAFLTLRNAGAAPRKIVALRSPLAAQVQIHEMKMVDGQMRMRELADPTVPAHGQLAMAPGGTHLMFMGLTRLPKAGETVPLSIRFDDGSQLELLLPVRADAAPASPPDAMSGHHHG
ncbi:copper chaperone PCu(A)C [Solimonas soli]|uniref:copper chaperone PCu(A)C n=1 Tax=Solimonas soli TaxID=413479 RepID=UPI0004B20B7D|nr:copper chaperone PCu(A)C [Solimonas soli]